MHTSGWKEVPQMILQHLSDHDSLIFIKPSSPWSTQSSPRVEGRYILCIGAQFFLHAEIIYNEYTINKHISWSFTFYLYPCNIILWNINQNFISSLTWNMVPIVVSKQVPDWFKLSLIWMRYLSKISLVISFSKVEFEKKYFVNSKGANRGKK